MSQRIHRYAQLSHYKLRRRRAIMNFLSALYMCNQMQLQNIPNKKALLRQSSSYSSSSSAKNSNMLSLLPSLLPTIFFHPFKVAELWCKNLPCLHKSTNNPSLFSLVSTRLLTIVSSHAFGPKVILIMWIINLIKWRDGSGENLWELIKKGFSGSRFFESTWN